MMDTIRRRVYGIGAPRMEKKAAPGFGPVMAVINSLVGGAGNLLSTGSAYLLGAALLAGAGTGWGISKLTSKGKRDIDTVQKGYDNERLKADIGYLAAKLKQEKAEDSIEPPKAARIFNT